MAAGIGSVAAWLAGAVGPEGVVFATDVDLSHLGQLPPNVAYAEHDIVTDSLPDGALDLVRPRRAIAGLLAAVGADMGYASSLPDAVRRAGLGFVGGEAHSPMTLDPDAQYVPFVMTSVWARRPA